MEKKYEDMIALVREHEEAERVGDLERTLATLAPYPAYDMVPFGIHFEGPEATRKFYEDFFASGLTGFKNELLGMWVNDYGVIREDSAHLFQISEFFGITLPGPRDTSYKTITIFPFENGMIKGERSYFDRLTALEQLGVVVNLEVPK